MQPFTGWGMFKSLVLSEIARLCKCYRMQPGLLEYHLIISLPFIGCNAFLMIKCLELNPLFSNTTLTSPGSTEKLVLIDIEMHHQHSGGTHPSAPPVSRQIHRILPTVVRQYLLQVTRTDAYCEWHQTDCLIYRNRILWHQQERGPLRTEHGMYFRIVIPPPPDATWWQSFGRCSEASSAIFPARRRIGNMLLWRKWTLRPGELDRKGFLL